MVFPFDRKLLIARKLRALANPVEGCDFLMHRACEDLAERLSVIERKFENAVTLFCFSNAPAATLHESGKVASITRIEADGALLELQSGIVEPNETVPVQSSAADLVVSLFALHEINDVPGVLVQVRNVLKPDGLFLAGFAGAGTLAELRESLITAETELSGGASARIYPFMDVRDAGALLQRAGFALPVADVETTTVRYNTIIELMRDLRAMGATSALADRPSRGLSRQILQRAGEIYSSRFADADGRIRATFNTIWISGWAPHASQQQPLKPGSAKASLARALSDLEKDQD